LQYIVWRMQRLFGFLVTLILYPIKVLLFIPVLIDRVIDRILYWIQI
jgi:hypothetical protein